MLFQVYIVDVNRDTILVGFTKIARDRLKDSEVLYSSRINEGAVLTETARGAHKINIIDLNPSLVFMSNTSMILFNKRVL